MRPRRWSLPALLLLLLPTLARAGDVPTPKPGLRAGRATLIPYDREQRTTRNALHLRRGAVDYRVRPDLQLIPGNRFTVSAYKGDRSVIVDLGRHALEDIRTLPSLPIPAPWITSVALVQEGHVYLIRAENEYTDHIALLRVDAHVPDGDATVRWVVLAAADGSEGEAPVLEETARGVFERMLQSALDEETRVRTDPRLLPPNGPYRLQLRTGDQQGQVSEVRLDGHHRGIDRWSRAPLAMDTPPRPEDKATAHATGGRIPAGQSLVIEAVIVEACSPGDENGSGGVFVRIGPWEVHREVGETGQKRRRQERRIILHSHGAQNIIVQAASTSLVDVTLEGRLVPTAEARALKPASGLLVGPSFRGTLELGPGEEARERTLASLGKIPKGKALQLRALRFEGRGPFEIRLGERKLVEEADPGTAVRGASLGRWMVHGGEEPSLVLRVLAGGYASVHLEGVLRTAEAVKPLGPLRPDPAK